MFFIYLILIISIFEISLGRNFYDFDYEYNSPKQKEKYYYVDDNYRDRTNDDYQEYHASSQIRYNNPPCPSKRRDIFLNKDMFVKKYENLQTNFITAKRCIEGKIDNKLCIPTKIRKKTIKIRKSGDTFVKIVYHDHEKCEWSEQRCEEGKLPNQNDECVCKIRCKGKKVLDQENCMCKCDISCTTGTDLNEETCTCSGSSTKNYRYFYQHY